MKKILKTALILLILASLFPGAAKLIVNVTKNTVKKSSAGVAAEDVIKQIGTGAAGQAGASEGAKSADATDDKNNGVEPDPDSRRVNVLLTGIDRVGNNSDVIMLISVDPDSSSASILQIPRDTYINSPSYGFHKLGSVYSFGFNRALNSGKSEKEAVAAGSLELASLLERISGISIEGFVSLDRAGLAAIVDSVGGVSVDIPSDLDYDDNSQDLHIHFKKGVTLLDGAGAERFLRFRSGYLTADYGRMDAQKLFVASFIKKVRSELDLPKIIGLSTTLISKVTTNLSPALGLASLPTLLNITPENVSMITLKGLSVTRDGVMYEILNKSHALSLFKKYAGSPRSLSSFDPDSVLSDPSDPEIDSLYSGPSPFSTSAFDAENEDRIKQAIMFK